MKRFINILPVSIIIISLILSGIQGVKRFSAEQSQKDVQILVTYNDIKKRQKYMVNLLKKSSSD